MIRLRSALRLLAVAGLLAFTGLTPESSSATDICSCNFCRAHPSVDCQIGPGDGYSILCADYLKLHNCASPLDAGGTRTSARPPHVAPLGRLPNVCAPAPKPVLDGAVAKSGK